VLVPWTPLSLSRRERNLRRLAQALAGAAAVALLLAAWRDGPADPAALVGALAALAMAVLAGRTDRGPALEVGVDASGALAVRHATEDGRRLERGLQCVFAAPWLITARHGTMWVRIWPDSLPGSAFRRFWVHVRWNTGRQPADASAPAAPGRQR